MANRRSRPADSVSMSMEGHLDSTTPTAEGTLRPDSESRSLMDDVGAYDALLDLAGRLGVLIVPGKS